MRSPLGALRIGCTRPRNTLFVDDFLLVVLVVGLGLLNAFHAVLPASHTPLKKAHAMSSYQSYLLSIEETSSEAILAKCIACELGPHDNENWTISKQDRLAIVRMRTGARWSHTLQSHSVSMAGDLTRRVVASSLTGSQEIVGAVFRFEV